ncbi:hypothetical protein ASE14_10770 [Agromyces sp. Root81]|uniref:DUF4190 domain-containing protein n=1 Tax=Agromyces sp. Root81 TaxID=1736601 RepID=UPI0007164004|nr:DUF4190 domain-containing protein [Agromyces sp. Root81]KRC61362.1 hypothetical protein ASE14_10770 [Agromyces sp. Root81]
MTTPAPAPVPAQSAPTEKWNVLAIVGFVLSLLGTNIVAIVLGFIALSQVKKSGERGRGLAIAAIIIGFASIVIYIIIFITTFALVAANTAVTGY